MDTERGKKGVMGVMREMRQRRGRMMGVVWRLLKVGDGVKR